MSIRELIEQNPVENLEFIVWKDYGHHICANPSSYPHFDYYKYLGSTELNSLCIKDNKVLFDDSSYIDIDEEIPSNEIDYWVMNQEDYAEYDEPFNSDLAVEYEPLSTILIAVDPNVVKKPKQD